MTPHNDHYFSQQPQSNARVREYQFTVGNDTFTVQSDAGLFSSDRLDKGTAVLLDAYASGKISLPEKITADVVDLGCGAGPLTLVLARRYHSATVWAVDVNERARSMCAANARAHQLSNVKTISPEDIPSALQISVLWSNPPIRIGKEALHQLLLTWLNHLAPDGIAHFVISKNLGADSLTTWLTQQGFETKKSASSKGFRVLSITRRRNLDT